MKEIIKFLQLKFAAADKPISPAAKSAGTCEEGKVNTCGCKQCEYFKTLEREVLKFQFIPCLVYFIYLQFNCIKGNTYQ